MIGRRDAIGFGAATFAILASEATSALSITARRKHDPRVAVKEVQKLLLLIAEGDHDKFVEESSTPDIFDDLGEVAGDVEFLAFSKRMTESDGKRDNKPLRLGSNRKILGDEYVATYLGEVRRSRYFKGYDDPEGIMTVEEGFHELSESWLFTFEGNAIKTARALPELSNLHWYDAKNG